MRTRLSADDIASTPIRPPFFDDSAFAGRKHNRSGAVALF